MDEALFDLEADLSELTNLAAKNPEVVKQLEALAEQCREDLGDSRTHSPGKNIRPAGKVQ